MVRGSTWHHRRLFGQNKGVAFLEAIHTTPATPKATSNTNLFTGTTTISGGLNAHQGSVQPPSATIDLDTIIGHGGAGEPISINNILSRLSSMQAELNLMMDRTSETGIAFYNWTWPSMTELRTEMLRSMPNGEGLGAFVDPISIFPFGLFQNFTSESILATLRAVRGAAFNSKTESDYICTFQQRYPTPLVGESTDIIAGKAITAMSSVSKWRGGGSLDGRKEEITSVIHSARERCDTYIRETLPSGKWRDIALRASSDSQAFIVELFQHLDEELTKCMQLKIPEAQSLILISDQLKIVYDELYERRKHVIARADCAKAEVCATCFKATMDAHALMQEFRKAKFKHHHLISAVFVHFLTKQMGENTSAGVSAKLQEMEKSIKQMDASIENAKKISTQCDSKLNAIVKANNLKTK